SSLFFYLKAIVNPIAYHPYNFLIHFHYPYFLFIGHRKFIIDKKTRQLFLFGHTQWIEIISRSPRSQQEWELNGRGVNTSYFRICRNSCSICMLNRECTVCKNIIARLFYYYRRTGHFLQTGQNQMFSIP